MQKIKIQTVIFAAIFLSISCNSTSQVDEIDDDNDGKIDLKIFWKKDGTLEKIFLVNPPLDSKAKDKRLYSEAETVIIDGKKLNKQKDLSTLLPEESTYMYTEPFNLVFEDIQGKFNNIQIHWRNNKLHKIIADKNKDGVFDIWAYYDNGTLLRIEKDTDFDGIVDEVRKDNITNHP